MTSDAPPSSTLQDTMRAGVRDLSAIWWWFLSLGVLWTLFGMYVLSYRVGSLAAVAAFVGVAFLFGGLTQLAVAGRVHEWRWLFIVAGLLGVAAGTAVAADAGDAGGGVGDLLRGGRDLRRVLPATGHQAGPAARRLTR
jgi:uncharacterized membrane protein HdeD (DUF308 family)